MSNRDRYLNPASPANEKPWPDDADRERTNSGSRPLLGTPASRQVRRLQLRNAGFRATTIPARKVTPTKTTSGSTNNQWSGMSGGLLSGGSDAENKSAISGLKAIGSGSLRVQKRRSSGAILQEISNSGGGGIDTLTRQKKHGKGRRSSRPLFTAEGEEQRDTIFTDPLSSPLPLPPAQARNTIRAKSLRSKAKMSKPRRSVSGEARMYIDHLEAELASAQAQLQAVNSPSVTREQTIKMRAINHETKQLQEELAAWETKYEQRVQEVKEEHYAAEVALRAHIRKLEEEVQESRYRVEELETAVDGARQNMEAVEAANLNLEKRLEIMSELLAASPSKLDLHVEVPGMMRRQHQRPKSMLPRFPTAGSLAASPERQIRTQPTSPLIKFAEIREAVSDISEASTTNSDAASEAESVFSDLPTIRDSITSLEQSDVSDLNPWTVHAVQSAKSRPARRMRRFGPGSHGPKPLILPATTSHEFMLASAPPLQRSETQSVFSFPIVESEAQARGGSPSGVIVRRRASTMVDAASLAKLEGRDFLQVPFQSPGPVTELRSHDSVADAERSPLSPLQGALSDFSSIGRAAGRNLMEELCAVQTSVSAESCGDDDQSRREDMEPETTLLYGTEPAEGSDVHSILSAGDGSLISPRPLHQGARSVSIEYNGSTWERLRALFRDVWHSPVALARHLVQRAASRLRIPKPLLDVQWWLVGVLLGPMARRRMLGRPALPHSDSVPQEQPLLEAYSPPVTGEDDAIAYGTMYHTPQGSPKRTGSGKSGHGGHCEAMKCGYWSRHSPWVWLKFSITLAFAVGVAFKEGPASLLKGSVCHCSERKMRPVGKARVKADRHQR